VAQKANLSFKNRFFYISVIHEPSDFKFGMQLRFAKAHRQIPLKEKSGCGLKLGELPEIWGFPFNISATAEANNFKFGTQLGCAKAHHKITPRGKRGHGFALGELPKLCGSTSIFIQWLKLGTSNLIHSLSLPRPTIKLHPQKMWGWPWAMEAPMYLGFPFSISAAAALFS